MNNLKIDACIFRIEAPEDLTKYDFLKMANISGVVARNAKKGDLAELYSKGTFQLKKAPVSTKEGDLAYFDILRKQVTVKPEEIIDGIHRTNTRIGFFVEDESMEDINAEVCLV